MRNFPRFVCATYISQDHPILSSPTSTSPEFNAYTAEKRRSRIDNKYLSSLIYQLPGSCIWVVDMTRQQGSAANGQVTLWRLMSHDLAHGNEIHSSPSHLTLQKERLLTHCKEISFLKFQIKQVFQNVWSRSVRIFIKINLRQEIMEKQDNLR